MVTVLISCYVPIILLFCLLYVRVDCVDEVCYPSIGCFTQEAPWTSILRPVPKPLKPEEIGVGFYIFTKKIDNIADLEKHKIRINAEYVPDKNSLNELDYDPNRPMTVFLVHGFLSDITAEWMRAMATAYFSRVDANVIAVNWGKGASVENYFQAAANTRVVAAIFTKFVQALIKDSKQDIKKIHCIGHSLGAQIMGYVGKNIPDMKRGTALDPARPCFEGTPPEVRLDEQDFEFVDVVHTNGKDLGFGYTKSLGAVDFFVNGGKSQPGCVSESFSAERLAKLKDLATEPIKALYGYSCCSHSRAIEIFLEALQRTDCTMWGHPMTSGQRWMAGFDEGSLYKLFVENGEPCTPDKCVPIGIDTHTFKPRGDFFVKTSSEKPFCVSTNESG